MEIGMEMIAFSEKTYLLPFFGRYIETRLCYGIYSDSNSLAVLLFCRSADLNEDLLEDEDYVYDESLFDEVFGAITVNLESSKGLPFGEQFIDINNYPQIAKWLVEQELAFPTKRTESSGRVLYPSYQFQVPPILLERFEKYLNA
jgi:hypothetical protein